MVLVVHVFALDCCHLGVCFLLSRWRVLSLSLLVCVVVVLLVCVFVIMLVSFDVVP